jgi:DNA-binding HxlR family transcriptional regulator
MKENKFIELLGQKGTVKILRTINDQEMVTSTNLKTIASRSTLYERLKQFEKLGLINKIKPEKKRETCYEMTEKGKRVIQILDNLGNLFKESE